MNESNQPHVADLPAYLDPDAVKAWIHEICAALEISPTELARRAQVAQTTLNRFLSGKSINKNLSGSTLASISGVLKRAALEGLIVTGTSEHLRQMLDPQPAEGIHLVKSDYKFIKMSKRGYFIGSMHLHGFIGYGIGMPKDYPIDRKFVLKVPVSEPIFNKSLRGYELREEDNISFPTGTILACIPEDTWTLAWFGEKFKSGSHCIIICQNEDEQQEGRVFRCEIGLNGKWWLIPTWANASAPQQIFVGEDFYHSMTQLFPGRALMVVSSVRPEL